MGNPIWIALTIVGILGALGCGYLYVSRHHRHLKRLLNRGDDALGEGDGAAALPYYWEALEYIDDLDEEGDLDEPRYAVVNAIGIAHLLEQDYDQAVRQLSRATMLLERLRDELSRTEVSPYCYLAHAYRRTGEHDTADYVLGKALAMTEEVSDQEVTDVCFHLECSADHCISHSDPVSAVKLYGRALELQPRNPKPAPQQLLHQRSNHLAALCMSGSFLEAEPLLNELTAEMRLASEEKTDLALCLSRSSSLHVVVHCDFSHAIELAKEAVDIIEELPSDNDAELGMCLAAMADAHMLNDEFEKAIELATRTLELHQADAENREVLINGYGRLSNGALLLSNFNDAQRHADSALELTDDEGLPTAMTYHALVTSGSVYLERERYREAENQLRQAIDVAAQIFGRSHPFAAAALRALSVVLSRTDRCEEAVEVAMRAVEICDKSPDNSPLETANSYVELSRALNAATQFDRARDAAKQALRTLAKKGLASHSHGADARLQLGIALLQLGETAAADEHLKTTAKIYQGVFGDTNHRNIECMDAQAALRERQGRAQEAEDFRQRATAIKQLLGLHENEGRKKGREAK